MTSGKWSAFYYLFLMDVFFFGVFGLWILVFGLWILWAGGWSKAALGALCLATVCLAIAVAQPILLFRARRRDLSPPAYLNMLLTAGHRMQETSGMKTPDNQELDKR